MKIRIIKPNWIGAKGFFQLQGILVNQGIDAAIHELITIAGDQTPEELVKIFQGLTIDQAKKYTTKRSTKPQTESMKLSSLVKEAHSSVVAYKLPQGVLECFANHGLQTPREITDMLDEYFDTDAAMTDLDSYLEQYD